MRTLRLAAAVILSLAMPGCPARTLASGAPQVTADAIASRDPIQPSLIPASYSDPKDPSERKKEKKIREIPRESFAPGRNTGFKEDPEHRYYWWMYSQGAWKLGIGGNAVPDGLLESGSPVEGGFGGLRAEYLAELPWPGRVAFSLTTGMGGVRVKFGDITENVVVFDPMVSAHVPVAGFMDIVLGAGGWWGMALPIPESWDTQDTVGGFGANAELQFRFIGL